MAIKKNKIHNPQIITDPVPTEIRAEDIGRLWVDHTQNKIVVAVPNGDGGAKAKMLLDDENATEIIANVADKVAQSYFIDIRDQYATIIAQTNGDTHYDSGYDFFGDVDFLNSMTQDQEDYYSFFYIEVPSTTSSGYLRTISTVDGSKHIRKAIGADNYVYNSQNQKVVNYSKILLAAPVKDVVEIKFENKDVLEEVGYELQEDKQTILIYGDPEGFFINKQVKVKYVI